MCIVNPFLIKDTVKELAYHARIYFSEIFIQTLSLWSVLFLK